MLEKLRAQVVRRGPSLLRLPISLTPFALQRQLLEQVLHWQFRSALEEGDLDFLAGRWLKIEVTDLGLNWAMTVEDGRLRISQQAEADVVFSGNANDLILIADRRQDPDTLFFQRRLRIEGDTELGLNVKNLMDAIDPDGMPPLLRAGLKRLADMVAAGLAEDVAADAPHVSSPC